MRRTVPVLLFVSCVLFGACSSEAQLSSGPVVRESQGVRTKLTAQNEGIDRRVSGLSLPQVAALVEREFDGLFVLATDSSNPVYAIGDFDGDGLLDVAAFVRTRKQLGRSSQAALPFQFSKVDFARDGQLPAASAESDRAWAEANAQTIGNLARYQDLRLVVVVHGAGSEPRESGSLPRRPYVLADGWSHDTNRIDAYDGELEARYVGDSPTLNKPPRRRYGEAILLRGSKDEGSVLLWTGTCYAWFPYGADF